MRSEGIAEGEARGGAAILLKQLTRKCGPLPEDGEKEVRALPLEMLADLGEALLDFQSLEDLRLWLASRERPSQTEP